MQQICDAIMDYRKQGHEIRRVTPRKSDSADRGYDLIGLTAGLGQAMTKRSYIK